MLICILVAALSAAVAWAVTRLRLTTQNQEAERELNGLRKQLEEKESLLSDARTNLATVQQAKADTDAKQTDLELRFVQLETSATALEQRLEQLGGERDKTVAELAELRQRFQTVREERATLEATLEQKKAHFSLSLIHI